ncbi:sigma-70 family RNA polymerase sigma factor [Clostridium sp. DL1XJH146]
MKEEYKIENISRDEMITQNLSLVHKIARGVKLNNNMSLTQEDLYSVGIIGLMEAVDKYDKSKNAAFATFATLRIRGAMIDEIRKHSNISRGKVKKINEYNAALNYLRQKLLREPYDKEVSDYMQISLDELDSIKNIAGDIAINYLDKKISGDSEGENTLKDLLVDRKGVSPEDEYLLKEKNILLVKALDSLQERERIILNLIYKEELALKEIAYVMDISISRVSQIHGRALKKLKVYLEESL